METQLFRDRTPLALIGPTVSGTAFTYTTQLSSFAFGRSDSGIYTCTATIRPQSTTFFLTGNEILSSVINIRAGKIPTVIVFAPVYLAI